MGIYARDVADFSGTDDSNGLGDRLASTFKDVDVDSVEEVRKLREK